MIKAVLTFYTKVSINNIPLDYQLGEMKLWSTDLLTRQILACLLSIVPLSYKGQ